MITGAFGGAQDRMSADPEREVEALLPCLPIMRSEEARIEDVVEMLNVLWESPPVPTMSHCDRDQVSGDEEELIRHMEDIEIEKRVDEKGQHTSPP